MKEEATRKERRLKQLTFLDILKIYLSLNLDLPKDKITLYKEQTVIERNIPEDKAVSALINLIKKYGDWVEKN